MRLRGTSLLALLALACRADVVATHEAPAVTFAPHAWRGGTLRLASPDFCAGDSWQISVAGAPVAARSVACDTLEATLPDTTGTFEVFVEGGGWRHLVGTLTLHGALVASRVVSSPDATAMAWPYAAGTFLYGVNGRLTGLDVVSGTETPMFTDSLYSGECGWGPWPAGGNALILAGRVPSATTPSGRSCRLRMVSRYGSVVDSFPGGDREWTFPVLRVADGSWLSCGGKGGTTLWQKAPDGSFRTLYTSAMTETWRMIESPDGRYAFTANGVSWVVGLPIFHAAPLDTSVLLPRVTYSEAATFTESGDTLVVQAQPHDTLFLVGSATGAVLASRAAVEYGDFAVDPRHPWLYAVRTMTDTLHVTVDVFDLGTLRLVTQLRAPTPQPHGRGGDIYLALDLWRRRLNVLATFGLSGYRDSGLSFELMP